MSQHCDSTMMSSLFQRCFSNSFCTAKSILYLSYTSPKYLHIDVNLFGLLFSNFTQWFQALTKWFYFYLYIILFFLTQIRGEVHQWKLSTRFSALRDSRTKTHFMRYKESCHRCLLLFLKLHIIFQFYQGFYLLEDYVKSPFVLPLSLIVLGSIIAHKYLWLK